MTDAVLAVRVGTAADGLSQVLHLDGEELAELLEHDSWMSLRSAVDAVSGSARPARDHLVLFTRDGRTLEADVVPRLDAVAIELHDVSRHVDEADQFARLAMQLHRRNRDLQTVVDATSRLGATLDVAALVTATAEVLAEYLGTGVVVTAAGHESGAGGPAREGAGVRVTATTLPTVRGDVGTIAWWRQAPLTEDERQIVDVVRHRAAVSIDHALLLAPPPGAAALDAHGLLSASEARRRLAAFVRPHALAVVAHGGDPTLLAGRLQRSRAGDVRAHWGPGRVLLALAGMDEDGLRAWLDRAGIVGEDAPRDWSVAIATVEDDVEAAVRAADQVLRGARG